MPDVPLNKAGQQGLAAAIRLDPQNKTFDRQALELKNSRACRSLRLCLQSNQYCR
ncbi:MAG: hypothetical protein QHH10_09815 [Peptococcaceae bacterium]|nr:hypothetical protein [Peptococcaceae bacterium]MDH7525596.1 hypothetical protein [Peptococcaceae bacterium]